MNHKNAIERAAIGAAAGLIGTVALQALMTARRKAAPRTAPPMWEDPGEFMVHQAEKALPTAVAEAIPETAEKVAAKSLGIGYGMTFGAIYGALREGEPCTLADGTALGVATWAAGFLGWLPATGLMPPVWKHSAAQAIVPILEHAAYGVATVAAYDAIRDHL